jgi:uncharacterized protein YrzB (UPF0473 family)
MSHPSLGILFLQFRGGTIMEKIEVGEVFTISDESDIEQEVEVIGTLNIDGSDYAAVSFVDDLQTESDEDIDIFFLKLDEDGDFAAIESDEEFEKVSAAFDEMMNEEE